MTKATKSGVPVIARPSSKLEQLVALLKRSEGATLDEMAMAATWLPHTTRAALTGLKKRGHLINSVKADDVRTYRITEAGAAQ
jgi:hypothetical protein